MSKRSGAFSPKGKFLLVDRDIDTLHGITVTLHNRGYEVRACDSYEEALTYLGAETYDFILVDQGSPYFEGRAVLDRAMEIDRHTPVLIVTRFLHMACYLEAMQRGAVDYLVKPIPSASLIWVIGTHLPQRCAAA
ncbi:MAG: response regulator [Acidobacteriota bacterium]